MASMEKVVLKEVACVICGVKSHRLDWQDDKPHQCDSHEVVTAKAAPAPASAKTPNGK